MGLTRREQAEHDDAIERVAERGPAVIGGMPRHVYVPDDGPHENGTNCWFVFMDGEHTARCRSSRAQHERSGWVEKEVRS